MNDNIVKAAASEVKPLDAKAEADAISDKAATPDAASDPPRRKARMSKGTRRTKRIVAAETNKATAEMLNAIFFSTVSAIGGEDADATPEEAKGLNSSLADYLNSNPNLILSPGIVLAGVYANFTIKKFSKEKPAQRLKVIAYQTWTGTRNAASKGWRSIAGSAKNVTDRART